MASIYRELSSYDILAPDGSDIEMTLKKDKLYEQYTKHKNKKHYDLGTNKYVYIIVGKDHSFLAFCNIKYNKNEILKEYITKNCDIIDSIVFNPKRPLKKYFNPDYYKVIITDNDVCFYVDKSIYDYYLIKYNKKRNNKRITE